MDTITVYVSIGNSDDKLSQAKWAHFHSAVHLTLLDADAKLHGVWTSHATSPWQNACWCFDLRVDRREALRAELAKLAAWYRQDSIAWAEAVTEFIRPVGAIDA